MNLMQKTEVSVRMIHTNLVRVCCIICWGLGKVAHLPINAALVWYPRELHPLYSTRELLVNSTRWNHYPKWTSRKSPIGLALNSFVGRPVYERDESPKPGTLALGEQRQPWECQAPLEPLIKKSQICAQTPTTLICRSSWSIALESWEPFILQIRNSCFFNLESVKPLYLNTPSAYLNIDLLNQKTFLWAVEAEEHFALPPSPPLPKK